MTAQIAAPADRSAANRVAMGCMVAAVALFSLGDMTMKYLTSRLPVGETLSIRMIFAITLVFCVARFRGEVLSFRLAGRPILWVRSLCEGVLVVLFMAALSRLSLGDLTTITQTTPIMMTALAAFFLREQVGWRRWSAAAVGFLGVALVARPGAHGLDVWMLVGLAVALLVAIRDLMTRYVPADVPTAAITLGASLASGLAGASLAPFEEWRAPAGAELALCAVAAALTTSGNLFIIHAFRVGDVSAISPFRYVVIPFALLWGFLAFGEVPDLWAIAGIALIIAAGVYTLHRERIRARTRASTAPAPKQG